MADRKELVRAIKDLQKGLHPRKLEVLALLERHIAEQNQQIKALQDEAEAYKTGFLALTGPGHTPPDHAISGTYNVAKPALRASYWQDGPWHCLRVEERTVGYYRPTAFYNKTIGRAALRQNPVTEQWMLWIHKIAVEIGIKPLEGSVRMLVFPGLRYTLLAWREVDERPAALLHPMDCDNACKPSLDSLQAGKPPKVPKPKKSAKSTAPIVTPDDPPRAGAFVNDTQVVDLLVYRLMQNGLPAVDRLELHRTRSKKRQEIIAKRRAEQDKT